MQVWLRSVHCIEDEKDNACGRSLSKITTRKLDKCAAHALTLTFESTRCTQHEAPEIGQECKHLSEALRAML